MRFVGMGDNVVDRYVNKKIMFPGGNALNCAVYAKNCGADSAYLGVIAGDQEGRLIKDSLIELDIDITGCHMCRECVTERCDVILREGDRVFVGSSWEKGREHRPLRLNEQDLEYLSDFDIIHCGCYAEMEDEMQKLNDFDAIRTFDFSSEEEYRTDDYLAKVCPYVDIALFSGERMDKDQMDDLQKKVRAHGTAYVLVTNGKKGQILFDGTTVHEGMVKLITPVDTMGAGDSFFTSFVVALVQNGWRKKALADSGTIRKAFEFAADFSAKTCLTEGSFGFGACYE